MEDNTNIVFWPFLVITRKMPSWFLHNVAQNLKCQFKGWNVSVANLISKRADNLHIVITLSWQNNCSCMPINKISLHFYTVTTLWLVYSISKMSVIPIKWEHLSQSSEIHFIQHMVHRAAMKTFVKVCMPHRQCLIS